MIQFDADKILRAERARGGTASAAGVAPTKRVKLSPFARLVAAKPAPSSISALVLGGIIRLYEFIAIVAIGLAMFNGNVQAHEALFWRYLVAMLAMALGAIVVFQIANLYRVTALRTRIEQLSRVAAIWSMMFLLAGATTFFVRPEDDFSRVWAATWYGGTLLFLCAGRLVISSLVRHWSHQGRLVRRTVIVGGGADGENLIRTLEAQRDSDIDILGVFDDRNNNDRSPPRIAGLAKLGTVDELVEFARMTRIDLLLVSIPITAEDRVLQMLRKLSVLPVELRFAAHASKVRFHPRAYSYIGNVPTLHVLDKPIADWNYVAKWLFDRIIGSLLLIAALPLMVLCAIAIKLDSSGPVFFRQKRYGFNNELIEVLKFRSMYIEQSDADGKQSVTKDDPRVTRIGRFIRKTSLDELPQLINVAIKGNLSLVGPRPHALHSEAGNQLFDEVVDGYFARHRVKPGITGWAQVNGWRGETDTNEKIQRRVEHDLYYIENWSVFFDLHILARTPFALLHAESAY